MARDPNLLVAKVIFAVAGNSTGTVSSGFAFNYLGPGSAGLASWTAITNAVKDLYTGLTGPSVAMMDYMSPAISRASNTAEIAIYQIDPADPHHFYGSPVNVTPWTLPTAVATSPLPNEVSIAASIRGPYGTDPEHSGSTRPRASDRGRIYLGPWGTSAVQSVTLPDGSKKPVVNSTLQTSIINGLIRLWNSGQTTLNAPWCVWSRKEALFKPVLDYALDTEFDTQRRRGGKTPLQSWIPL